MNLDQVGGIIRALIPGLVAALTHYGIGTDATDTALLTAAATGIVAGWSAWTNKDGTVIPAVKP